MQPPKLVADTLRRVLRIARFDGMSVLFVAGFFALVSGGAGDVGGAAVGLLVAAAGAIELHGASLLKTSDKRGMSWLIGSQLYLLVVILAYVVFRISNPDVDPVLKLMTTVVADQVRQSGQDVELFLSEVPTALRMMYLAVAALTIIYQGGMAFYYLRRRAAVAAALDEDS
jgi:hypothetical protein